MGKHIDYRTKFESFSGKTLYEKLPVSERQLIRRFAFDYRLTFQEFRQIVEASRDLSMWHEGGIDAWWQSFKQNRPVSDKRLFIGTLNRHLDQLRAAPKSYRKKTDRKAIARDSKRIVLQNSGKKIYGMCPVASDKTVCCNLRTIDVVENCVFGCSYCTIQTFYTDDIRIEKNIAEKLDRIELDHNRFYHFGTGQASDSLAWGNREGILDAHFRLARKYPNMLLEFKTKSKNIEHFLISDVPANIVCSWSLNPQIVIDHEEHFTAALDERLTSARKLSDRGIKVAFHFHPMVYYDGWENDYTGIAGALMERFVPEEVLFISFGSVTLIKPVVQKIRELGNPTKILQMRLVPDPHGKLTYPDEIKIRMFSLMHGTFRTWHKKVFFYLCMEKRSIWESSLGYAWPTNERFEQEFGKQTMRKIRNSD